jgi:hypothetical protein
VTTQARLVLIARRIKNCDAIGRASPKSTVLRSTQARRRERFRSNRRMRIVTIGASGMAIVVEYHALSAYVRVACARQGMAIRLGKLGKHVRDRRCEVRSATVAIDTALGRSVHIRNRLNRPGEQCSLSASIVRLVAGKAPILSQNAVRPHPGTLRNLVRSHGMYTLVPRRQMDGVLLSACLHRSRVSARAYRWSETSKRAVYLSSASAQIRHLPASVLRVGGRRRHMACQAQSRVGIAHHQEILLHRVSPLNVRIMTSRALHVAVLQRNGRIARRSPA